MASFGTDLYQAYGLLSEDASPQTTSLQPPQIAIPIEKTQAIEHIQPKPIPNKRSQTPQYDNSKFNSQFEMEKFYQAQQQQQNTSPQIQQKNDTEYEPTYIDKMVSKRKELMKVLTFSMIIMLAIAVHTTFDFWVKESVVLYGWSYNHELGLRLFYPFLLLFILWNFKTFK